MSCLGHSHPDVLAAMHEQLDRLAYAHTSFFTTEVAEELADELIAHAPEKLERVIASLEELQRSAGNTPVLPKGLKRRGRKSMDPKERQDVSERMKRYWDARRKQEQTLEQSKA